MSERDDVLPSWDVPGAEQSPFPALAAEMEATLAADSSGHTLAHGWRVFDLGRTIAEQEGADPAVVGLAALVHDLHRVADGSDYVHPEATLVLSFTGEAENLRSLLVFLVGVAVLLLLARSTLLNRAVTPVIERLLEWTTELELADYTRVLGLQRDYRIAEVLVDAGDWFADATPRSLELGEEGVRLLGIRRGDAYIGAPGADTEILPGDILVLYGREDRLQEIAERAADDQRAHESAVEEQEALLDEQADLIREL